MNYTPQVASVSTDKLAVLVEAAKSLPPEMVTRLSSFELNWTTMDNSDTLLPVIKATFR